MVTNKRVFGRAGSMAKGVLVGTIAALVITIAVALLLTQLILSDKMDFTVLGYSAMIMLPLASAVSALISVGIVKRRRMQTAMLAGVAYFVMLSLINFIFFGGHFDGLLVTILLILGGAFCVGIWGIRGERGHHKKH